MRPLTRTAMLRESTAMRGKPMWLEILFFIAVFYVAQSIMSIPVSIAQVIWMFTDQSVLELLKNGDFFALMECLTGAMPDWVLLVNLFCTPIMTVTAILFCRLLQKRELPSLGFRKRRAVGEYLIGALLGIALFSLAVLLCCLTGSLKFEVTSFSVAVWLLFLVGFLVQGMSEEVLCRGYFMPSLARRHSLAWAIVINSLLFSALHLANPGISLIALLNIALFGALASLYVLRRGDLWGVCAMHSLWNFVQGNVFGVSVSGTGAGASPLQAIPTAGHELWTGGSFGLEGGLAVTVVLSLGILVLLFLVPTTKQDV